MRIIRFTALWCADCIVMRPRWKTVFSSYPGLDIVDYDFDDDSQAVSEYQVKRVPELIFVGDDGSELERLSGMQDTEQLKSTLDKYFKSSI